MSTMSFMRDILSRLHAGGFPEAIIAGGAIRDWDNSRENQIKDIDVFVEDHPMYLHKLSACLPGFTHRVMVPERVAQYMQFEGVVCVHEFALDGPIFAEEIPPIQIIVMNRKVEPYPTIERHDFGICQAGFDGKEFYFTKAYMKDHQERTFTLCRCRNEKDRNRSMKRWERLSLKYTGWSLVA